MKHIRFIVIISALILITGCHNPQETSNILTAQEYAPVTSDDFRTNVQIGQVYLYGEEHSNETMLKMEFKLWHDYYHNKGMRHLFIELPYYSAEYLNQWMHSDNDDILNQLYRDIKGTQNQTQTVLDFYKKIKAECPETIFHGIDVGHQYKITGERFLKDILKQGYDKSSEKYKRALLCIEQGKKYYGPNDIESEKDHAYRENAMVENFIREYQQLNGADIMGIFGGAHINLEGMNYKTAQVPCMANQLKNYFTDSLHSEMLPYAIDIIQMNGKDYQAFYFGKVDINGFKDLQYRKVWRLKDAYDDFKDHPVKNNVLPYGNYPMPVEVGNIYILEYGKTDGTIIKECHRADGHVWNNKLVTQEIQL